MNLREWDFVLDAMSEAKDWLEDWFEGLSGRVLFEHFDLHRNEDHDLVCMLKVTSTSPDIDNIVFRCVQTLDGVKVTAYQVFDISED